MNYIPMLNNLHNLRRALVNSEALARCYEFALVALTKSQVLQSQEAS